MSTSELKPQSAADRRSAEVQIQALVEKFAPSLARLISGARRALRKRLPTANELVYAYRNWFVISYSPSERGYQGVLCIRVSPDEVRLCFNRGKELPDPAKLLRSSGGMTRWMELERASSIAKPPLANLIDEALARNSVPFASAGRGAVLIHATTSKKRRRTSR